MEDEQDKKIRFYLRSCSDAQLTILYLRTAIKPELIRKYANTGINSFSETGLCLIKGIVKSDNDFILMN